VDTVLAFPSSKRVHGPPHHSHLHASSDSNNNPTTSHSDSGPSHYKNNTRGNDRYQRSNARAIEAPSSSSVSVFARLSDKPSTASLDNITRSQELEVCAASRRKCITQLVPQHKQQSCQVSHMGMDIDQEGGAVDGSSDEGCAVVDVSLKFVVADPRSSAKEKPVESDWHKLGQRQKQIDYGKNTLGYERYLELVPRKQRKKYVHPQTPDIKQVCSKRSWDGQVKKWRRRLHEFDPPAKENEETPQLFSTGDGSAAHSQEEKDATTPSDSEDNPNEEIVVSTIYDDWNVFDDAMEP